ncbi:MAG: hypothetical protein HY885_07625 [Deltaproteobacteria bacterium]|nr:hypothetical protein [Deltaproteobacteria bacterium]
MDNFPYRAFDRLIHACTITTLFFALMISPNSDEIMRLAKCYFYRRRFYRREARFLRSAIHTNENRQSMGSGAKPPGAEA